VWRCRAWRAPAIAGPARAHWRLREIAREIGLRLLQRCFERPAIEREEDLPLRHVVAFLEADRRELARDLRADGHARRRFHGSDGNQLERHRFALDLCDCHGHRRRAAAARTRGAGAFRAAGIGAT